MLVNAFRTTIFPYIVQLGVILFVFSIVSAAYSMFRKPNWQDFIDKFKSAIIAYACVRGAFAIVAFIDKIINGIKL
jgi:amino acid permease